MLSHDSGYWADLCVARRVCESLYRRRCVASQGFWWEDDKELVVEGELGCGFVM
jgi:hypothetical protein